MVLHMLLHKQLIPPEAPVMSVYPSDHSDRKIWQVSAGVEWTVINTY